MIKGLPEKLIQLRETRRMTQKEVADRLHISPSLMSGYEVGTRTPSVENLIALSDLYRCSVDYLLGKKSSEAIDTSGLTDEQIEAIRRLIETIIH